MPLPRWALLRRASGSKKTPEPEGMQYLSLWETAILGLETHLQTSAGCLGCKTRLCNYAMLTSPRAKLRPQSPEGRSLRSYSTSLHLTITTTITTIMLTRTIMTIIVMIIIIILTMMIIMIIMIMISIIIRKHETFMLTNVATYRRWLSFPPRGLLAGAVFPTPGPSTLLYSTLLYSTLLYSTLLRELSPHRVSLLRGHHRRQLPPSFGGRRSDRARFSVRRRPKWILAPTGT